MRPRAAAIVAAGLAAAALAAAVGVGCRRPGGKPNVLLLVMDTTRADRCSFEGCPRPTTPRLDAFAKDAVVFRDAWSPGAWTGPAHATLFTGLRPARHGFYSGGRQFLRPGPATLAERLAAGGWSTGCFTNNPIVAPSYGLDRGFARYEPLWRDDGRPYPYAKATHERAAAWAEAESEAGRPFFLYVNDMEPHLPYTPPAEDLRLFAPADATEAEVDAVVAATRKNTLPILLDASKLTPRELGIVSGLYDAELHALDREVGVFLDRLKADGLLDQTIVVVAGDHGESLGEHGVVGHGHDLHRAIRHVPLLVRFPHGFDGGGVVDDVVRLEDVAPTILELCGLAPFEDVDGLSLTHGIADRVAPTSEGPEDRMRLFLEANGRTVEPDFVDGVECVYDGRLDLVRHADGRTELYDVAVDPGERDDLASRRPADVARLRALFDRPPAVKRP